MKVPELLDQLDGVTAEEREAVLDAIMDPMDDRIDYGRIRWAVRKALKDAISPADEQHLADLAGATTAAKGPWWWEATLDHDTRSIHYDCRICGTPIAAMSIKAARGEFQAARAVARHGAQHMVALPAS